MDQGEPTEWTSLLTLTTRSRMNISRLTIIKLIELVLAAVIVWFHYKTYEADGLTQLFIITSTYGGYCLIVLGTFLGQITGHPVNRTMDMFFCIVGTILYIASGSISINTFKDRKYGSETATLGLTMGALAIVQGALFILDAFFVFRIE